MKNPQNNQLWTSTRPNPESTRDGHSKNVGPAALPGKRSLFYARSFSDLARKAALTSSRGPRREFEYTSDPGKFPPTLIPTRASSRSATSAGEYAKPTSTTIPTPSASRSGEHASSRQPLYRRGARVDAVSEATSSKVQREILDCQEALPALQARHLANTRDYEPMALAGYGPDSFDLVPESESRTHCPDHGILERRCDLIFSKFHMSVILRDFEVLEYFTGFIRSRRPGSVALLEYYLTSVKALAALKLTNSVLDTLKPVSHQGLGLDFTQAAVRHADSKRLEGNIAAALGVLATDDLPAFVAQLWMTTVEKTVKQRITGVLPSRLQDLSEGLAETFCLTDASKRDNPIVFASAGFHTATQYGTNYAIGRNCRFLQGPKTSPAALRRLREKIAAGEEHHEVLLNYRRDGSQFMNLLMVAPLKDLNGKIRYFLGAQVDVSGLATELSSLDYLKKAALGQSQDTSEAGNASQEKGGDSTNDPVLRSIKKLSERLTVDELDVISKHGGRLYHPHAPSVAPRGDGRLVIPFEDDDDDDEPLQQSVPPSIFSQTEDDENDGESGASYSPTTTTTATSPSSVVRSESYGTGGGGLAGGGHLGAMYERYLLVRPAPSLRIVFASPALRVPGLVQSSLLERIGGSPRVRQLVTKALQAGQAVTANIMWLSKPTISGFENGTGRPRWLHATPMLSFSGAVGVWMIVLVDDDTYRARFPGSPLAEGAEFQPAAANIRLAPTIQPYHDRGVVSTDDDDELLEVSGGPMPAS